MLFLLFQKYCYFEIKAGNPVYIKFQKKYLYDL